MSASPASRSNSTRCCLCVLPTATLHSCACPIRSSRRTVLKEAMIACAENDLRRIKDLAQTADFNPAARSTHGWTALHISASEELDVDCRTHSGLTPMHLAARNGFLGTIKVLYKADAQVNVVDAEGFTPLHYAAFHGHDNVVKYFVAHGADTGVESNLHRLPADVAITFNSCMRLGEGSDNYTRSWLQGVHLRNSREDAVKRFIAQIPRRVIYQTKEASFKDFQPVRFVGKGGFGEVYIVKEVHSGNYYALKSMKKSYILKQGMLPYAFTERSVLITCIGHPFIGQLCYAFQTPTRLLLALDFYPNGDFRQYLSAEKQISEDLAKIYAAELFLAIEFLHDHDIIYRDFKPDNIVVDREGHLRLIDFGLAKEEFPVGECTSSFCGTLNYLAPEMIQRKPHDHSLDWYMFGCFLYEMLVGKPPFLARQRKEVLKLIEESMLTFPATMSEEAMDLIQGLMCPDPKQRLGAKDSARIKTHRFFGDIDWRTIYERRGNVPLHMQKLIRASSIVPQIKVYGDVKKSSHPVSGWTFTHST